MSYKKILTIQDISCVGQCSLTVALPILSACGMETCILPSAILSTHTAGFQDFTFRDLTDDMPNIQKHWQKENIKFSAIYTGYLGSTKQIGYVKDILSTMGTSDCVRVVDPAMADNGKLYPAFDGEYVEAIDNVSYPLRCRIRFAALKIFSFVSMDFFCCLDNPVVSSMIITPYLHPSISQIEKSFKKTEHALIYFCFHTQYASNADGIEYFSFNTSSFAKIISLLQFFSNSSTRISYPFMCHST